MSRAFPPFPDCRYDVHRRRGRDGGVDGGGGAVGVGGEHGLVEGVAVGGIVAVVSVAPVGGPGELGGGDD